MSTLQETEGKLVLVRHVELVKPDSFAIGFADVFDGIPASGGETIWKIELFGYFGYWNLAKGIVYLVDAIGAKPIGAETLCPKIVVFVSRLLVSTSIRGIILWR
jgi:hypothetical protein